MFDPSVDVPSGGLSVSLVRIAGANARSIPETLATTVSSPNGSFAMQTNQIGTLNELGISVGSNGTIYVAFRSDAAGRIDSGPYGIALMPFWSSSTASATAVLTRSGTVSATRTHSATSAKSATQTQVTTTWTMSTTVSPTTSVTTESVTTSFTPSVSVRRHR